MTLQARVLGYLALTAVVSCVLTVGVAVVLVRRHIESVRRVSLQTQANLAATIGGPPGALRAGNHVYRVGAAIPRRVRPVLARQILAQLPSGDGQGTVSVADRSLLWAARQTATGRIVLIRSARLAFGEWRSYLSSLLVAGLGGILIAIALSFLVARRLSRPIGALSDATRRVAAGEAGVAVPVRGDDELAGLGRSFNRMSAELGEAQRSQRRFLESVSHELKTPLTSIRGYAEALTEGAVEPAQGGRVIGDEADRLQRLVLDLLDLARLGRADFAVEHRPVDLAAVAAAAVTRHRPRARELGVTLSGDEDEPAWGIGDEGRLLQAASNLIENALRLTPAGGSVTVAARAGEIEVSDTGPGLEAEDLPHAFERFYLYNRYRSERAVGSGLGLALVKELTAAMGGEVRAAARPEGGARFTLTVPATAVRRRQRARTDASRPCA
ncbi:MAG: HAMP domain-containing histidine kinase [Solirubrobacterales bacterium]|nr:HAMP domain-containing histidine kinase [Solirubrobacterales bacterium]